jgi:hypothetical protein
VGHQVAGDGDEERVRLLLLCGVEAGLEQGGRRVDALGVAGGLKLGEVGGLGGGGGSVEDGGPVGGGVVRRRSNLAGSWKGSRWMSERRKAGMVACEGVWAGAERGAKQSRATRGRRMDFTKEGLMVRWVA